MSWNILGRDFFLAGLFTQGVSKRKKNVDASNLLQTKRTWVTALPPLRVNEGRSETEKAKKSEKWGTARKNNTEYRCRKQTGRKKGEKKFKTLNLHTFHRDPYGLG